MSHWDDEANMTCALTAHLLLRNLHTASVADNTLIAYTLVLAAVALVVLCRTEDALAEETITLGLVCAVVDGFRLQHLTTAVLQYFLWRSQADGYLGEIILNLGFFLKSHVCICICGRAANIILFQ